jgi:hypothetical protein
MMMVHVGNMDPSFETNKDFVRISFVIPTRALYC